MRVPPKELLGTLGKVGRYGQPTKVSYLPLIESRSKATAHVIGLRCVLVALYRVYLRTCGTTVPAIGVLSINRI